MNLNVEQTIEVFKICQKAVTVGDCRSFKCPAFGKDGCKFASNKVHDHTNKMLQHAIDVIQDLQQSKYFLELTLEGVMHFVDKWLEGDELKQDCVNRAATMREKTLRIVERLTDHNANAARKLREMLERHRDEPHDLIWFSDIKQTIRDVMEGLTDV